MRKLIQILIPVLFLAGCAGPIKQSWNNFTAYYNTFYNAKKYYSEGEELNRQQAETLNPEELIHIYPSPSDAGAEQFDEAIAKSASILRDHEQSSYVVPSILMIGKSYHYKSEFFSALEKFREASALAEGQNYAESILWEARTLFEMDNFAEGLTVTSSTLTDADRWDPEQLGELYALDGQLHAAQENWEQASLSLIRAEELVERPSLLARVYFLHGQVLEQADNQLQARVAFRLSAEMKSDYDVEFYALKKQADISRRIGEYDEALLSYRRLERDDKFSEHRMRMRYEIARTNQVMGNSDLAYQQFSELLHHPFDIPDNVTRARAYFGLGELFRDERNNFTMAAAYFDSAASLNVSEILISDEVDASELAESFGEYAALKRELAEKDSLLLLAMLEPSELDSVIAEIRMEREEEMRELSDQSSREIVGVRPIGENTAEAAESAEFGFLNHLNRNRLMEASDQFQAIWGNRPLEDNWRRIEAVSGSRFNQAANVAEQVTDRNAASQGQTFSTLEIDLSAIPFEEEDQMQMKLDMEELNYRLANLFLLALNMPDSARFYYEKQLETGLNQSVSPRSLFSLIDLDLQQDNEAAARQKVQLMIEKYPDSQYTFEVAERMGLQDQGRLAVTSMADRQADITTLAMEIEQSDSLRDPVEMAFLLQKKAYENQDPDQQQFLLYESARQYLRAALRENDNIEAVNDWLTFGEAASVESVPADSAAADTLGRAQSEQPYPFEGVYWDSTRSMLQEVLTFNRSSRIAVEAADLSEVLRKPESVEPDTIRTMVFPPDRYPTDPGPDMNNCLEAGLELDVEGGLAGFISRVQFPDWAYGSGLKTDIVYLLTVNSSGEIVEYSQVSEISRSGIPEAVEEAIDRELQFKPLSGTDLYRCEFTLPIEL